MKPLSAQQWNGLDLDSGLRKDDRFSLLISSTLSISQKHYISQEVEVYRQWMEMSSLFSNGQLIPGLYWLSPLAIQPLLGLILRIDLNGKQSLILYHFN